MLIDGSPKLLRAGLIFCFEFAGSEWLRRRFSTTFPLSPGPQLGTLHANAATWMKTPQYQSRFPVPNTSRRERNCVRQNAKPTGSRDRNREPTKRQFASAILALSRH
jgi:hypothetical protein